MVKNNKKLIIKAKSSQALNRLNESVENGSDEKYIFEGVFTACSTADHKVVNRNNRIYMESEVLRHLQYLRENIQRDGMILGELDHPQDRFDTRLSEAACGCTDLWYDFEKHCVMGKMKLLDTPNGLIARKISENYPIYVSSRACGSVNPKSLEVSIDTIFCYDIVCTSGFEEARLNRVNESKLDEPTCRYINESLEVQKKEQETTEKKYGILCEGVTVCEPSAEVVNIKKEKMVESLTKEDIKKLAKPLNEDDEKNDSFSSSFTLPQPSMNPGVSEDGDDKNKEEDKKDSDTEDNDTKDSETLTDDEKKENRNKIVNIEAISADDELSDSEKKENREKILDVEAVENSDEDNDKDEKKDPLEDIFSDDKEDSKKDLKSEEECDKSAEDKEDENDSKDDSSNNNIQAPNEIKTKEKEATAKKVAAKAINDKENSENVLKNTKKDIDDVEALIKKAKKLKDVKESIVRLYPFSISLSDENFAQFAALKPGSKNKVQKFILEHDINAVDAINNLWKTPLLEEKRMLKNWLRLASDEDKRLFTEAPMEIQDAIEESAKYVMIQTQEDADKFWERTGLRQRNAAKIINESMQNRYVVNPETEHDETELNESESAAMLGYSANYMKMLEDMY
jgi:hypothetical protein